ncbi:MAG: hypothetical protein IBX72_11445 [Nitrospirae bacterium]|nr:hypothetical protein [Nitrospirota bacterium]
MSLEASYSTDIVVPKTQMMSFQGNLKESPCMDILRLAMKKVIEERGVKLDTSYTDNEGKIIGCLISVRTNDFPRGVGADIEGDGRVVFRYDAYGNAGTKGKAICDEINQNYNVIAVMKAQKRLGFNVDAKVRKTSSGQRVVTVVGVR